MSKWANEIRQVVPDASILICLTKKDLIEYVDSPITKEMIVESKDKNGFQGSALTSSKEWDDFNVHKMFTLAVSIGYFSKYD